MAAAVADCARALLALGSTAHAVPASAAEATARALVDRYRQPHRRYHTLAHVEAVLATVDRLVAAGEPVSDIAAVHVAAWYHDAVYDRDRRNDEERSATLATRDLTALGVARRRVAQVAALVRVTADHRPTDSDGRVLVDADLAVLAGDPGDYADYADAVRTEYADVDDATFATGRAVILRGLLERPSIYSTATMRDGAEPRARANVAAELARLEAAHAGRRKDGPSFTDAVAAVVAATVPGDVLSYGDVAAEAGWPGAGRAVGGVLRRRDGLPWWRVVTASGRLAPGKEVEQARRLRAEGVTVAGRHVQRARGAGRDGEAR